MARQKLGEKGFAVNSKPFTPEALPSILLASKEDPSFEEFLKEVFDGVSSEELHLLDTKVEAWLNEKVSFEDLLSIEDPLSSQESQESQESQDSPEDSSQDLLLEELEALLSPEEVLAIDEKVEAFMAEEVSLEDLLSIEDPLA